MSVGEAVELLVVAIALGWALSMFFVIVSKG
jgi:uncharacterized membrane protein YwzB